jgi:hypothetical protein
MQDDRFEVGSRDQNGFGANIKTENFPHRERKLGRTRSGKLGQLTKRDKAKSYDVSHFDTT